MNNDAYERACRILELMAGLDEVSDRIMEKFKVWLLDDTNREEKEAAMWHLFLRTMDTDEQTDEEFARPAPQETSNK